MQHNIEYYENVIVIPTTFSFSKWQYRGGVYQSNGELVTSSLRGPKDCLNYLIDDLEQVDKDKIKKIVGKKAIFMGLFPEHYGHYLIEGFGRMKYVLDNDVSNNLLVFNRWITAKNAGPNGEITHPYYKHFLDVFDLKSEQVLIVHEPTFFDNITIPIQNAYINHHINIEQKAVYEKITNHANKLYNTLKTYDRLFLLRNDNRLINERSVCNIFKIYGFTPLHLVGDTLEKDIAYVNNAKIIAGVEGTNIHNSVLMNPNMHTICVTGQAIRRDTSVNQCALSKVNNNTLHTIRFNGTENKMNIDYLEKELRIILDDIVHGLSVKQKIIKSAEYGGIDVIGKLTDLIKDGILELDSDFNKYFGDPTPGQVKFLKITTDVGRIYTYHERVDEVNMKCKINQD